MSGGDVQRGREPVDRVLRASRSRLWAVWLGCWAFTAIAIVAIVSGNGTLGMWLALVLFGGFSLVGTWGLRRPPRLELHSRTMTYWVRGKSKTYELVGCGEFHVRETENGRGPFRYKHYTVTFEYDEPDAGFVKQALMELDEANGMENHSWAPWIFGMKADAFAGLLNEYRARALASEGSAPRQH